jgi:uncharacterized protein YndB with AHSA1/START domain
MPGKNKPNELTITRIYDASVKDVWEAWVDPKKAAMWWGPRGFTITTHGKDLRPGGFWHYTMHGPDGKDWPNKTKYFEVEDCKKLVYDHGGNDEQAPLFRVQVLFSEIKGKTKMEMTMIFPSAEIAKESKKFIKAAGGNGTWDRLAEYVEKEKSGLDVFVINRSFEAPISKIFDMWTKPEHFSKWLPPTGFNMKILKGEIKPGSSLFYSMSSLDGGMTMYGRAEYLEVQRPDRLVYTQQFCDEAGNLSRHPGAPTWPETMLTIVTLSEEDADQTRVTIEWKPHGKTTLAELAAFVKERGGMTQGWTGSFDKLEELLAQGSSSM